MTKFDKKAYDFFKDYGVLINVGEDKRPLLKSWGNLNKSQKFNNKNMAIIPKKFDNVNYYLLIIDVDTKKGSKGLESLTKLENDIGYPLTKTVKTPSGGYHIYLLTNVEPKMKRYYNKDYKDIEFIHATATKNSYCLLPTNQGIKSHDSEGNPKVGEYKLLIDDLEQLKPIEFDNDNDEIIEELNKVLGAIDKKVSDEVKKEHISLFDKEYTTVTEEQLKHLLSYAPNEDYNEWVTYGGHYKKAGGTVEGFIKWSKQADNASSEEDLKAKWNVLPTDDGTGIGALYYNATQIKFAHFKQLVEESEPENLLIASRYKDLIVYPYVSKKNFGEQIETIISEKYKELFRKNITAKKLKNFMDKLYNEEYYNEFSDDKKPNKEKSYIIEGSLFEYSDLYSSKMFVGDTVEENELKYSEQDVILRDIFKRARLFKERDVVKLLVFSEDFKRASVSALSNNQASVFKTVLVKYFPKMASRDKTKLYINIDKIKKFLVTIPAHDAYELLKVNSIMFKDKPYTIDDEEREIITPHNKIVSKHQLPLITDSDINEIVSAYNNHWDNVIEPITELLFASKFKEDTKGLDIAIIAKSNFGKGFHFTMGDKFGVGKFAETSDYIKNGSEINNANIADYKHSFYNVFDEKGSYSRKLFTILGTMQYRGLHKHSQEIKVGGRVFLTADGEQFNSTTLDEQIKTRINIFDFRKKERGVLDLDIFKKYSIEVGRKVLENYYHDFYMALNEKYKNMDSVQLSIRVNELLETIKKSKYYITGDNLGNFNRELEETIIDMISDVEQLDNIIAKTPKFRTFKEYFHINKANDRILISNSKKVLTSLIISFNQELEYEFKFKSINSIAKNGMIDFLSYGSMRNNEGKTKKGIIIDLAKISHKMLNGSIYDIIKFKDSWINPSNIADRLGL